MCCVGKRGSYSGYLYLYTLKKGGPGCVNRISIISNEGQ